VERHLRAMRHGCGVGVKLDELDEWEWPKVQRWCDWLTEFLNGCLKPPDKANETPTL
jgi:hypothetical protein